MYVVEEELLLIHTTHEAINDNDEKTLHIQALVIMLYVPLITESLESLPSLILLIHLACRPTVIRQQQTVSAPLIVVVYNGVCHYVGHLLSARCAAVS